MSHIRFIILTATAAVFLAAGSSMLFAQGLITQASADATAKKFGEVAYGAAALDGKNVTVVTNVTGDALDRLHEIGQLVQEFAGPSCTPSFPPAAEGQRRRLPESGADRRIERVIPPLQPRMAAVGREKELHEIIGADGDEIHFLEQIVELP